MHSVKHYCDKYAQGIHKCANYKANTRRHLVMYVSVKYLVTSILNIILDTFSKVSSI